jgi:chromosome segregation ATPase
MTHPDTTPKDDQQPPAQDPLQHIDDFFQRLEAMRESWIFKENEYKKREAEQQAVIYGFKFKLSVKEGELQNTNWAADQLEPQLKELKEELQEKDGKLTAAEKECNALKTNLKTKQDELTQEIKMVTSYHRMWKDANYDLITVRSELQIKNEEHKRLRRR